MAGPNIIRAGWAAVWALRVRRPRSNGSSTVSHAGLRSTLAALSRPGGLANVEANALAAYISHAASVDPTELAPAQGLAFWMNLYNALAIQLALEATSEGHGSVLQVRSGFERPVVALAGEHLSLSDIEHGKIRRYHDPRIHGALVCGSLSCPTLRAEPFDGDEIEDQLADQMRSFARSGAVVVDRPAMRVSLSRVFLWYGSDFVRPKRMPTFVPAPKASVAAAVLALVDQDGASWFDAARPAVEFQAYDWGLGCRVA